MRLKIINYLKQHPLALRIFWALAKAILSFLSKLVIIKRKNMLFASYGGRKFDDSPKSIYDEICKRKEFDDWNLIWAFDKPEKFIIPRGTKIRIDSLAFFKALLTSHVWISNSGMSRGIEYNDERIIKIETWHGSVLKKGCGEENTNKLGGEISKPNVIDNHTVRCAQSQIDVEILSRLFFASKESFLKVGLPRNDILAICSHNDYICAKRKLNIPINKKVILYMPTWRQYDLDSSKNIFCKPPINIKKWEDKFGKDYILLLRAHYAVTASMSLEENRFIRNVSNYPDVNDLYIASDILITDYSSAMIDYSILEKPIFCFAYDYEKYIEKIGLYLDLEKELPKHFYKYEDDLINGIENIDWNNSIKVAKFFKKKHADFSKGNASQMVVNRLLEKLNVKNGEKK